MVSTNRVGNKFEVDEFNQDSGYKLPSQDDLLKESDVFTFAKNARMQAGASGGGSSSNSADKKDDKSGMDGKSILAIIVALAPMLIAALTGNKAGASAVTAGAKDATKTMANATQIATSGGQEITQNLAEMDKLGQDIAKSGEKIEQLQTALTDSTGSGENSAFNLNFFEKNSEKFGNAAKGLEATAAITGEIEANEKQIERDNAKSKSLAKMNVKTATATNKVCKDALAKANKEAAKNDGVEEVVNTTEKVSGYTGNAITFANVFAAFAAGTGWGAAIAAAIKSVVTPVENVKKGVDIGVNVAQAAIKVADGDISGALKEGASVATQFASLGGKGGADAAQVVKKS